MFVWVVRERERQCVCAGVCLCTCAHQGLSINPNWIHTQESCLSLLGIFGFQVNNKNLLFFLQFFFLCVCLCFMGACV